jgi:hypothetical protein
VTSLSRPQSRVWIDYIGDISNQLSSSSLAFDKKMSEKCKSVSPTAMQVQNWPNQYRRETLRSKKKVNRLLTYAVTLCMLILAYVQIMIILTQ